MLLILIGIAGLLLALLSRGQVRPVLILVTFSIMGFLWWGTNFNTDDLILILLFLGPALVVACTGEDGPIL